MGGGALMASDFRPFLEIAVSGRALTPNEMTGAMDALLEGLASDVEAAGFLAALRARGETVAEIAAAARVMREKALGVAAPPDVVDTCGTGGAGRGDLNVSTAAALVAAGAGVRVAKHGNRAASSKSGAADVLEALGVNIHAGPEQIAQCIETAGVGFMFARAHHKAVAYVAGVRAGLGVRTLFNLLGPLTNPARARRQVMGVYDRALVEPLANVLLDLGAEAAWVVHGGDGLDEITTTTESFVAAVENGAVRTFTAAPEDARVARASAEDLKGGDPAHNADVVRRLLDGEKGPFRDIVVLNAAAAMIVAGRAATLSDGADLARAAIDDGRAGAALEALIETSNTDLP